MLLQSAPVGSVVKVDDPVLNDIMEVVKQGQGSVLVKRIDPDAKTEYIDSAGASHTVRNIAELVRVSPSTPVKFSELASSFKWSSDGPSDPKGMSLRRVSMISTGLSAVDAAAKLLQEEQRPMKCDEMVTLMAERGYWRSTDGKTPYSTVYAVMLREINHAGEKSRFQRVNGYFSISGLEFNYDELPKSRKGRQKSTDGSLSAVDAAAKLLQEEQRPMKCDEMVALMAERGYWRSTDGKTPYSTVYAVMLREINHAGEKSRFLRLGKGYFCTSLDPVASTPPALTDETDDSTPPVLTVVGPAAPAIADPIDNTAVTKKARKPRTKK